MITLKHWITLEIAHIHHTLCTLYYTTTLGKLSKLLLSLRHLRHFETLGGMHHLAVRELKRLGAALARHTGSDEREVIGQLMQKISLHLMRGNAGMITSRRPEADFLPPELDGVE